MTVDIAQEKRRVHALIDRLAPSQLMALLGLLDSMLDPVARAIANASMDDEPVSAADEQALTEARNWLAQNRPIPHEQVLAELGITQEEIENYREPGCSE